MELDTLYQLIKDFTLVVLWPTLIFVLRVGHKVEKSLQDLTHTMYGPRGDNGVYGSVRKYREQIDALEERLSLLEGRSRHNAH